MEGATHPVNVCLAARNFYPVFGGGGLRFLRYLPGLKARGIDVRAAASVFLNGEKVDASISCSGGSFAPDFCDSEEIEVTLQSPPTKPGLHLLQVQNPEGPLSNELPICVGPLRYCR